MGFYGIQIVDDKKIRALEFNSLLVFQPDTEEQDGKLENKWFSSSNDNQ